MSQRHQGRLTELDLLRVVALGAVVLIHSLAWIVASPNVPAYTGLREALLGLSRFCVPAFLLASGLALTWTGSLGGGTRAFLAKRWSRIAVPWLAWTPVFAALGIVAGGMSTGWRDVGSWLAFGAGHLYFLVLVGQLYLVFLVMPRRGRGLVAFTAAAMAVQIALGFYRTYLPQPQGAFGWPASQLAFEEAPFYLGYFAVGCLVGANWRRLAALQRWWPLAAAAVAVTAGVFLAESLTVSPDASRHGTYTFLWPAEIPLTLSVSLLVLWVGRAYRETLRPAGLAISWVSRHSLGLYIVHPIFLNAAGPRLAGLPAGLRVALLVALALAGAALVVAVLERIPWIGITIGERARPLTLRKDPAQAPA